MRRYAAPLVLLAAAAGVAVALVTTGGTDPEPRVVRHVRMDDLPIAIALVKAAEQARLTNGDIDAIIDDARATEHLDARVPELSRDGVTLRDVRLRKDGAHAVAEATVSEQELAEYLPDGVDLRYDPKAGGEGIVFRGATSVLGVAVPVTARLMAEAGAVVVVPEGLPLGRMTLLDDARLRVERLSAKPAKGGLRVRVEGRFAG